MKASDKIQPFRWTDTEEDDRADAKAAFDRLSALNGYAEPFSLFAGEPLRIKAARKPRPRLFQRKVHVKSIEIRDAVGGASVRAQTLQHPLRVQSELPKSYRDQGADYRCSLDLETADLPPGLYECVLEDDAGERSQDIYFNIKPRTIEGIELLCVLPTFTWHAYCRVGGGSFYSASLGGLRQVSLRRPMSRKGDNALNASLNFLRSFAESKIAYACVDSADLHKGALPQGAAPVMALLTHDEYWSRPMRATIDDYLDRSGVLLVIAGNVCWWDVEVDAETITIDKTPSKRMPYWHARGLPEERTFLSSFRFGGYALNHALRKPFVSRHLSTLTPEEIQAAGGVNVVLTDHPLFQGVALGADNAFGSEVPILYREVDGIPLDAQGNVDRNWYDADDVEPRIIATGLAVNNLRYHPISRVGVIAEGRVRGGHVLHMGSFGWSLGLGQNNPAIRQVVLNAVAYCRDLRPEPRQRNRRGRRRRRLSGET
jgi:hypothetical protein